MNVNFRYLKGIQYNIFTHSHKGQNGCDGMRASSPSLSLEEYLFCLRLQGNYHAPYYTIIYSMQII